MATTLWEIKFNLKLFEMKTKGKKQKRKFFQGSLHQSYCPWKFSPQRVVTPHFTWKDDPLNPKKMTYYIGCVFLFLECFPWFDLWIVFFQFCFIIIHLWWFIILVRLNLFNCFIFFENLFSIFFLLCSFATTRNFLNGN